MSETYRCGDDEALVAYLYDEGDPAMRAAIEAHVATCARCAEEIEALGATRRTLAAWTPPDVRLGFQVTPRAADEGAARVLRPAAWWQRPLPAWAQVAAAVAIFAAGLALGGSRGASAPRAALAVNAPAAHATPAAAVTPQDLAAVEQRLRGEMSQIRQTSSAVAPASGARADADLLRRVQVMINQSEQRQRQAFAVQTSQVVRSLDAQRRIDLVQMQRNIGQIQEVAGAAVRGQNQMVNYLMNVSQQQR